MTIDIPRWNRSHTSVHMAPTICLSQGLLKFQFLMYITVEHTCWMRTYRVNTRGCTYYSCNHLYMKAMIFWEKYFSIESVWYKSCKMHVVSISVTLTYKSFHSTIGKKGTCTLHRFTRILSCFTCS